MRAFSLKMMGVMMVTLIQGCAVLHRVQYGEFDQPNNYVTKPFEIRLNQFGFDAARTKQTLDTFREKDEASGLLGLIALFQVGPRTGNPIYEEKWGHNILEVLHEKCPSGRFSGLMAARENREFQGVSGEMLTIKGFCLIPKKSNE
ncbi:MAG: hypothetical protein NZ480_09645 [Bdellovibrionaceae bacterium]|nr:hypothetical protein [Pseudobdellovibrionaceae bacterium]MDW8190749.1 hypothetical protein [Pseudobdellovibrionaceae bacterium]